MKTQPQGNQGLETVQINNPRFPPPSLSDTPLRSPRPLCGLRRQHHAGMPKSQDPERNKSHSRQSNLKINREDGQDADTPDACLGCEFGAR